MTAYSETAAGLVYPRTGRGVTEADAGDGLTVMLLENRIRQLELQLDEQGWARLDGSVGSEFSREGLRKIVELARVHYLKNPLIKRAVEVGALYVWGQDLSVSAPDERVQAVVDRFWADNRSTLTGQQASRLLEVELEVTGNVFLALFADPTSGAVRVRGVPIEEIVEIVCNPHDRAEVWYYKREWQERPLDGSAPQTKRALYPDWRYRPAEKPTTVGEIEVHWEAPLLHVKAGAFPHWRWGVPEVYAALDWARAYKEQLEDDATRSRALARFAWSLTTKGGKTAVAAAKTKLGTTLASSSGETNPPPAAGSTFIAGEGVDLAPIRIAGSTLDADHSRPARLMASAALGIPDHFFDANQSNLATSKTLDRPTELRFSERRAMWNDVLTELLEWVLRRDIEATRGLLPKTIAEDALTVELSWPDLLEPDVMARVGSVEKAAPFLPAELVSRLMMTALNVEDIDAELAKMEDERAEREEMAQRIAQGQQPPNDEQRDEERESFVAALRGLQEAIRSGGVGQ